MDKPSPPPYDLLFHLFCVSSPHPNSRWHLPKLMDHLSLFQIHLSSSFSISFHSDMMMETELAFSQQLLLSVPHTCVCNVVCTQRAVTDLPEPDSEEEAVSLQPSRMLPMEGRFLGLLPLTHTEFSKHQGFEATVASTIHVLDTKKGHGGKKTKMNRTGNLFQRQVQSAGGLWHRHHHYHTNHHHVLSDWLLDKWFTNTLLLNAWKTPLRWWLLSPLRRWGKRGGKIWNNFQATEPRLVQLCEAKPGFLATQGCHGRRGVIRKNRKEKVQAVYTRSLPGQVRPESLHF